ncbi:MAG: hypothetical protein JOZ41_01485 [Chloroflexi bacterium]|nr:hypothetical protein [Chloroflexota bacterium]
MNADLVFEPIGLQVSREEQESFLLGLVETNCIDHREFETDRDGRPLFTAAVCAPVETARSGR